VRRWPWMRIRLACEILFGPDPLEWAVAPPEVEPARLWSSGDALPLAGDTQPAVDALVARWNPRRGE